MSREAEQKLLVYATKRVGRNTVAQRLLISEKQLEKLESGSDWLSREQALALADLIIEVDGGGRASRSSRTSAS